MVKIARTLLLILFTCSLLYGATDYIKELKSYDKKIETSSKDELLRVYHGLKSIYIHSIVSNDKTLKKEVLKRLVKSSHELKLDARHYEKELATLLKTTKELPKNSTIEKPKLKAEKKQEVKKIEPNKKETIKVVKKSTSNKHSRFLKKVIVKDELLYLEFDDSLTSNDIKRFVLKSKGSKKEVYDIKAALLKDYKLKAPNSLEKLRIAQFDKKTMRVVIYRKDDLKSTTKVSKNKLRIYYNTNIKSAKKEQSIKPVAPKYHTKISANKTIVIDAGHGGRDGGAVGYKKKVEKIAVLKIALATGKELKKRGYKVYYTRSRDKFIKLRNRTKLANDKDADIFISIHANASPRKSQYLSSKGIETYFLSPARSDRSKNVAALENKSDMQEMDYFSKQTFLNVFNREKIIAANKVALDVQQGMLNSLRKSYKVRDGGVREAPFWVLVGAQMPSILIEVGYITNPTEAMRMFNVNYQKKLALGVADGIDSYFLKNNY